MSANVKINKLVFDMLTLDELNVALFRRRANARNVSFSNSAVNLPLIYQRQNDNQLSVSLARRSNTTVSFENNHFVRLK